jgi:IPT/TIG domain
MQPFTRLTFVALAVLCITSFALAQNTTLSTETSNNTSACSAASGHCQGAFTGMSDPTSGTYNAAPGPVSHGDMHALEYGSATTALFAHYLPWFCMQAGSTATGTGTSCNGHVQVGYNSDDAATVKAQMSDMQARGLQGPIIDWYGPNKQIENGTTLLVKSDLEGRCAGTSCPLSFAINEDQGSITRSCLMNGGGTDQTNCILGALDSDFDYMNANFFPSPAYLRVDATNMSVSQGGRPVVFFFICEECFTNPSPNWSYVWNQLRAHVLSYTTGTPLMWFIFRNAGGFTHTQSDGAFAWINHYGSNDPYGLVYLDNFYDTSLNYKTLQPWGASWKGFDNTNAPWKPTASITPQQCGNTWLQTFAEMTHNNDYGNVNQLPFLQVVTWNDYDEGSEVETGIDNCLSLSASVDSTTLSWTPTFSASSGSENTIDHYAVYSTTDGQNLTLRATVPPGTHAIPLSSMTLASGSQTFYVEAIGKAGIINRMSNAVAYSPTATVSITGVSPASGTTTGGTSVTISGSGFEAGATVTFGGVAASVSSISATSISAKTPAHAAGTVAVVVSNPDGTGATANGAYTYTTPSFTLTSSPTSRSIKRGYSTSFSITVTPQGGFTGAVTFSVSGLAAGTSGSFSPTSITTSGTTKLTVATTRSASPGTYKLKVTGQSGSISGSTVVSLTLR